MRIQKPVIFVGGICLTVGVYALSGYFGFEMDTSIVTGALVAIGALSDPTGDKE